MQKASSLLEVSDNKKELDKKYLLKVFENINNIHERNKIIKQVYKKGYSQYKIAKVLGISQPAVSNT